MFVQEVKRQIEERLIGRHPKGEFASNIWYEDPTIRAFLRYGDIILPRARLEDPIVRVPALTIANVTVAAEFRGRGCYTMFLRLVELCKGVDTIYVENVISRNQVPLYLRRGYRTYADWDYATCLYKRKEWGDWVSA